MSEGELREKCADIQLKLKLDDTEWKDMFGNEQGLYGFIAAQCAAARRKEAKECLQPYYYAMPMKSTRTRNTAFKLYAVKFFNTKAKERLQRRLEQLSAPTPKPASHDHNAPDGAERK